LNRKCNLHGKKKSGIVVRLNRASLPPAARIVTQRAGTTTAKQRRLYLIIHDNQQAPTFHTDSGIERVFSERAITNSVIASV
jgi:hypothetical protein